VYFSRILVLKPDEGVAQEFLNNRAIAPDTDYHTNGTRRYWTRF
jgi:hypothetical protein